MVTSESIRSMLTAGRHRLSSGRVCEIVKLVQAHPKKASQLIESLWDEDPGVAMRAADALEKLTRSDSSLLRSWKAPLLGLLTEAREKKLRWSLALVIPRLALTPPECRRAAETLQSWLEDSSSIVKTCALQGLADLSRQDSSLQSAVVDLLRIHSRIGTPAMRARGRKLLQHLEKAENGLIVEVFGFRTVRKG